MSDERTVSTHHEGRMASKIEPPEPQVITSLVKRPGIVPGVRIPGADFPGLNDRPDATGATVEDDGGPVMQHVQVVLVFWGSAWNGAATPSRDDVTNAVINILTGPYMSGLAQYHEIGGGSLVATATVSPPEPHPGFTTDSVQTMLTSQLGMNNLPLPTFNNQYFYIVIMPSGLLTGESNVIGEHSSFSQFGVRVPFAWVMNDGTLDYVTTVLSHELIEACTDPNVNSNTGIIVKAGPGSACPDPTKSCEIGDVCSSFALVGGVQVQSYWSKADNRCIIPQNIINGETTGNPALIQGRFLHPGNFEMACPLKGDGLSHYSRVNSIDFVPWFGPEVFATDIGAFDAISMIQSNFTTGPGIGNLELAALFRSEMLYYWREDVPHFIWHGPQTMNGFQQQLFTGNPVLIQGRFERRGNFEMVVPLASGGIAHYSRANDLAGVPWFGPNVFATELGVVDAVTMIQSNWTVGPDIGILEVIVRVGGNLFYYFREDDPPYKWWGPLRMNGFQPQLFTGNPVLIESRFGGGANFELIVPLASGGLAHYWRDIKKSWSGPTVFGDNVGVFDAISFIQSDFTFGGGVGNLELIARWGEDLFFYWREDKPPFTWFGPRVVVTLL